MRSSSHFQFAKDASSGRLWIYAKSGTSQGARAEIAIGLENRRRTSRIANRDLRTFHVWADEIEFKFNDSR